MLFALYLWPLPTKWKANAENTRSLAYVTDFATITEERIHMVENELSALNAILGGITATLGKTGSFFRSS